MVVAVLASAGVPMQRGYGASSDGARRSRDGARYDPARWTQLSVAYSEGTQDPRAVGWTRSQSLTHIH